MDAATQDLRPDVIDVDVTYVQRVNYRPWFYLEGPEKSPDEKLLETRRVKMHNLRGHSPHHDVEGFSIVPHKTRLTDFRDVAQIEGAYARELEEITYQVTGCAKVLVTPIRAPRIAPRSSEFGAKGTTFPAPIAHDDYNERTGPEFINSQLNADEARYWADKRVAVFSMWRAFSQPPQDVPVCFADARSVAAEDRQTCDIYMGTGPKENRKWKEGSRYAFSPRHRWCYWRDMTRDEIVFLKVYDTDHSKAWHPPHCSFVDPTAPADAPPRESLDVRVIAFWK